MNFQPGLIELVELAATVVGFQLFENEPFNLISDSLYVVGILNHVKHFFPKQVDKKNLFTLLSTLHDYV